MEELDMDEEVRPEFPCPYCYEDHAVASLCAHLEEEHPFEPHAAVSVDTPADLIGAVFAFFRWVERMKFVLRFVWLIWELSSC
ncbi:hypothetical protein C2845_PM15G19060 [Panicum miliaceum]|uniref:Di19 zinc-binding domain-containing protein n=1 Tax=Panicum miliaceum TaxID=4540 RepID=A0A3L6QAT9_PANMI|nr:hypothetical protein C2845_PM15G19060 [Panicum miliaceum]